MFTPAQVHFSLRGSDLVIRVQHKDKNDLLQLVPPDKLKWDLPIVLIEDHVHWLNLSTSIIEIRPLKNLWEQSDENWRIDCADGKYRVYKGRQSLVDMRSQTWDMVSSLLKGLDAPEHLVVTTSTTGMSPAPRLSVALPRHGLSFFVNSDGDLESDDFKEMVYDENQDIGTLFGLVDRLVLRPKVAVEEGLVLRCVLIAHPPDKTRGGISDSPATYDVYNVDTELGRLKGNSSWESKDFLSRAHARVSIDWGPDLLTGRTGAQEALSILRCAGYQSLGQRRSPEPSGIPELSWYPQTGIARGERPNPVRSSWFLTRRRRARRATYLFSPNDVTSTFLGDCNDVEPVSSLPEPQLEDTACTAASVIYHLLADTSTCVNNVSIWAKDWGDAMDGNATDSPSPYSGASWNSNLPQMLLVKVNDILQEHNGARRQFYLLFLLPTLAYCSSHPQTAFLSMFLAFAKEGQHQLGNYADYNLLDGYFAHRVVLDHHILAWVRKFDMGDISRDRVEDAVESFLRLGALPADTIPILPLDPEIRNVTELSRTFQELLSSCHRNLKLKEEISHVLREALPASSPCSFPHLRFMLGDSLHPLSAVQHTDQRSWCPITLGLLLSTRDVPALPQPTNFPRYNTDGDKYSSLATPAFNRLLSSLQMAEGCPGFQDQYIAHLHSSARHVHEEYQTTPGTAIKCPIEELKKHFVECRRRWMDALRHLKDSLSATTADPLEQTLARCGQWPPITTYSLLGCLASTSPIKISENWKRCLVQFALLLLELQHSRRLLRFASAGLEEEFSKELENEGCEGWDAEQYPDWLLVQVCSQSLSVHVQLMIPFHACQLEGDFFIRRAQANTAMEIISPQSGENSVMQVNMGEGKSSVIVPVAAATLADGHRLVRVIVPKSLTTQMKYLLVDRLGGLANRPIYQLPFSRSDYFWGIKTEALSKWVEERGVVLVSPEDVLSLKLRSVESQVSEPNFSTPSSSKLFKSINYDVLVTLSLEFVSATITESTMFDLADRPSIVERMLPRQYI